MTEGLRVEKLTRDHILESFDCGQAALNRFLVRYALVNQLAEASQTYLAVAGGEVVGFYSLTVGHVELTDASERLRKGLARHPIPVMILARLAVAVDAQGRGVGRGLLRDAMRRTLQAAEIAGIRALAVHAKDDSARQFYERFDFLPSPTDPYHLYRLMKDIRGALGNETPT